jgi:biopolymer transport protein ExbD
MNLYNFRTFLALFTPILLVVSFAYWNLSEQKETPFSFIVKIQKEFREDFSQEEVFDYVRAGYPVPENSKNPALMWNIDTDPLLIVVIIQNDGRIKLNKEMNGDVSNTEFLTSRLKKLFEDREEYKVYAKGTNRTIKKVIVRVPPSTKYGDFLKVIDSLKSAGAEPIVLQIDDLPN